MKKTTNLPSNSEIERLVMFVETLFQDRRSMATGAVLQAILICCVWASAQEPIFAGFLVVLALGTVWRLSQTKQFLDQKVRMATAAPMERYNWSKLWEKRFAASTTLVVLNAGCVAEVGLQISDSKFTLMASLCIVFAILPFIVGRIFGSKMVVLCCLFALFSPLVLGFFIRANLEFMIIAVLALPYSLLVLGLVKSVREPFIRLIERARELTKLANRFDTAVNTMTHGLVMLDENRRILVMNEQARFLFNVPDQINPEKHTLSSLLRMARIGGRLTPKRVDALERCLGKLLSNDGARVEAHLGNDLYLAFSMRRRHGDGAVLVIEDVSTRVASDRRMAYLARHDTLTGLLNRSHFEETVSQSVGLVPPGSEVGLILLDVDGFKHINDSIGHHHGDEVLVALSQRLSALKLHKCEIARHGGDEFMIFVADPRALDGVLDMIRSNLNGTYVLSQESLEVSVSVGAYRTAAVDFDLAEAMVRADIALYRSKALGKGIVSWYESDMEIRYRRRQMVKRELANAIERDELTVLFQPIFDARKRRVTACEALCRWTNESLGFVSPAEFIPLAEESGLIGALTTRIIRKACFACVQWPEHVRVSVNLSAMDFKSQKIVDTVRQALEASGLDPSRLDLEITETAVIENERTMRAVLDEFRAMGVHISLDDFGTGHSSLSYLHTLPLDTVKVDRSFVIDIETTAQKQMLLRNVIGLCHDLKLKVTVEGVETLEQLTMIADEMKADHVQGFVFSPALPSSGIEALCTPKGAPSAVKSWKKAAG